MKIKRLITIDEWREIELKRAHQKWHPPGFIESAPEPLKADRIIALLEEMMAHLRRI